MTTRPRKNQQRRKPGYRYEKLPTNKTVVVTPRPGHGTPLYAKGTRIRIRGTQTTGAVMNAYRTTRERWEYVILWDTHIPGWFERRCSDWADGDIEAEGVH